MAELPAEGLEVLCQNENRAALVRTMWGIARCTCAPPDSSIFLFPPHQEFAGRRLVSAMQRRKAQFAKSGKIRVRLPPKLRQKRPFLQLGPMGKINHLAKADVLPATINRLCVDATHADLLRQVRGSPRILCSDFRCYVAFCELRKITPPPPTEEAAVPWICVFNNTATYGNYVSYLQK